MKEKSKCLHIFLLLVYLQKHNFCFFSIMYSVQCCQFMRDTLSVAVGVSGSRFVKEKGSICIRTQLPLIQKKGFSCDFSDL